MAKKTDPNLRPVARPGFTILQAPDGFTSASTNGASYDVGSDGTVQVPSDQVATLIESFGFVDLSSN
jgi:hypothetical protein